MSDEMDGGGAIGATSLDGVHQHFGPIDDRPGRRGRHEHELATFTSLEKATGERLLDVHEVVEAAELREPKESRHEHDVMFGH